MEKGWLDFNASQGEGEQDEYWRKENESHGDISTSDDFGDVPELSEEHLELLNQRSSFGSDDAQHSSVSSRKYHSHASRWLLAALVLIGLFALVSLVAVFIKLSGAHHPNDKNSSSDQPATDFDTADDDYTIISPKYVLDPNWKVDTKPERRVFVFVIRDREHNPDGVYRPMILINDRFPGPLIEANEGDKLVVEVENQSSNSTSIHWHGIYQNDTNWMDGTVGVTQCPISPGESFTYEFDVNAQSGTYWYHSHQAATASDGVYGPLIVHSRNERQLQKLDYSTDRVLMVSDHYHDLSGKLLMDYLAPDMENAEPIPDSGLINGRGRVDCSIYPNRKCDNSTQNVGYPHMNLERGKRHRLRFINTGAFAEFQVSLDEHALAVTEVDGTDVDPRGFHGLNINPGQRYSVVVNANHTSKDAFFLRAKMLTDSFQGDNPNLQSELKGVVAYGKGETKHHNNTQTPKSKDFNEQGDLICKDINTTALVPVEQTPAPIKADATFYVRLNFEIGAYQLSRGFFNQSSWRPDVRRPSLLRALDGLNSGNSSFAIQNQTHHDFRSAIVNNQAFKENKELVVQTEGIQVIDLIISNFDDGKHPLHLHGYKYFVLAQGHGYPPSNITGIVDLTNPLRRDTATVEAFGWIVLRVVADNPGLWAFHCHNMWHTEAGLLMQLMTRSNEIGHFQIPHTHEALCNATVSKLEKGKGPKDEVFYRHES
ncbi:MAG: hypothetical protein M1831_002093 [Alyxoria varia]|nr:MAG: hypothetical protein M1831_002093 [Alyxoria varia]